MARSPPCSTGRLWKVWLGPLWRSKLPDIWKPRVFVVQHQLWRVMSLKNKFNFNKFNFLLNWSLDMLTLTEQRGHTWELTTHLKNIYIRKPRWSNSLFPPSTDNSQCSVRVPVNTVWTQRMSGRRPLLRKHHNFIFFDLLVSYQLVVQEALALCPESSTCLKILFLAMKMSGLLILLQKEATIPIIY